MALFDEEYNALSDDVRGLLSKITEVERSKYFPKSVNGTLTKQNIIAMRRTKTFLIRALSRIKDLPKT